MKRWSRAAGRQVSLHRGPHQGQLRDAAIRTAMRLGPRRGMLLLDEVCYTRLCRPVLRALSYYTNFSIFRSCANCCELPATALSTIEGGISCAI